LQYATIKIIVIYGYNHNKFSENQHENIGLAIWNHVNYHNIAPATVPELHGETDKKPKTHVVAQCYSLVSAATPMARGTVKKRHKMCGFLRSDKWHEMCLIKKAGGVTTFFNRRNIGVYSRRDQTSAPPYPMLSGPEDVHVR
jgi:hypothetical protein